MNSIRPPFPPGTLLESTMSRTGEALATGKLKPIDTIETTVEAAGVPFLLRLARNLVRKVAEKKRNLASKRPANPFLPCEEDLCVGGVSDTHLVLLNKFNVLSNHLLVVTREFEPQDCVLGRADFEAQCRCMVEFDSLGFYNSGSCSGASQPHKHLQVLPLPLSPHTAPVPIAPLLQTPPTLPFKLALRCFGPVTDAAEWAGQAESHYRDMLRELEIDLSADGIIATSYNLLMTRDWIFVVPRSNEHFGSISVNALGFAGSFFAKNEAEMETIREVGPLEVLAGVGMQ